MSDEQTAVATPPSESVSTQTVESQVAAPAEQSAAQSQDGGSSQVETSQQQTSSQTTERTTPRPSDYYFGRKQAARFESELKDTKRQVQELLTIIKQKDQASAVAPSAANKKPDPNEYWADPIAFQEKREAQLREEIRKELLAEIPKHYEGLQVENQRKQREQEAMELIFPKEPNSKETLAERINKNPDKGLRIKQILEETTIDGKSLDELSTISPTLAVQHALSIYNEELKQKQAKSKNPNIIDKKLVGGAPPSGNPNNGGARKMGSIDEIKGEFKKLDAELERNPNLRLDPTFIQKKQQLMGQLRELATKTEA